MIFEVISLFKKEGVRLNFSRAVNRGGNWDNGADAGPFCANLNNVPGNTNTNLGFRCCNSFSARFLSLRR